MVIVSDGKYLAIQDHDLNTDDRIALDRTPFRVLLRKDVNLLRDAELLEVQEGADVAIVALRDKSRDSPGAIKLFFSKSPDQTIDLAEWITTDAQGLQTRVEVSRLDRSKNLSAKLFKPSILMRKQR